MLILSVESTCDETAVAITEDGRKVLTDQIFSQADLHAVYGGVVPEIASRSHVEVIAQLADRAVEVDRAALLGFCAEYSAAFACATIVPKTASSPSRNSSRRPELASSRARTDGRCSSTPAKCRTHQVLNELPQLRQAENLRSG